MPAASENYAIVAGVGDGLGLALCKRLVMAGYTVGGLSRTAAAFPALGEAYVPLACDLTDPASVDSALTAFEQRHGVVSVYIHNAARLLHREFLQTSTRDFRDLWDVICLAAVNGTARVLPAMLADGHGTVLFTGATASVKAGGGFAAFASAKFALRGLAQSLAREYAPQGIHVCHVVIDGVIKGERAGRFGLTEQQCLDADAIAETYLHLVNQPRSAWTLELDLRPDVEQF